MSGLTLDPFFDADGRGPVMPGPTAQMPSGYLDASASMLDNGTTQGQVIPRGPRGLIGTVVPGATSGGVSRGVNPHNMTGVVVNVDPHIKGQSVKLRIDKIRKEAVLAASERVAPRMPAVDPANGLTDLALRRFRASAALHELAGGGGVSHDPQLADAPRGLGRSGGKSVDELAGPVRPTVQQPMAPLQAFNTAPPQHRVVDAATSAAPPAAAPAPTPAAAVGPPTVKVTFDFGELGQLEGFYHEVVKHDATLVLIFDSRYVGPGHYVPPKDRETAFAAWVEGSSEVYLVRSTGVQWAEDDGRERCMLMIERSAPAPAPTQEGQ